MRIRLMRRIQLLATILAAFLTVACASMGQRLDYATTLESNWRKDGKSIDVWTEGEEATILRIESDLDYVTTVNIPALRNDTESRRTLKRLGFKQVIVEFDVGDPVTVTLD